MNDNPLLPDDPDQSIEAIERHLRAFKPRTPRLDLAAIEQAACAHARSVVLPQRHTRRPGRWMSVIAGSWVCGAVAGALAMFVILNSGVSRGTTGNDNSTAQTTQKPHATPAIPGTAEPAPKAALARSHDESHHTQGLVFAAVLDARGTPFGDEQQILCAGSYLRGFSPQREHRDVPNFDLSQDTNMDATSPSEPRRQPLTTRKTLLRELLNNDHDSIL